MEPDTTIDQMLKERLAKKVDNSITLTIRKATEAAQGILYENLGVEAAGVIDISISEADIKRIHKRAVKDLHSNLYKLLVEMD